MQWQNVLSGFTQSDKTEKIHKMYRKIPSKKNVQKNKQQYGDKKAQRNNIRIPIKERKSYKRIKNIRKSL